ncbi:hypothetical protein [Endozoicomonas sp. 2B-B]
MKKWMTGLALADGFYAAQLLRQQHPEYFALLSTTTLQYNFSSDSASLSSTGPVIELGCEGEIIGIRINNRSVQPMRLPMPARGKRHLQGAYADIDSLRSELKRMN